MEEKFEELKCYFNAKMSEQEETLKAKPKWNLKTKC